jgi:hypothetical protein
VAGVLGPHDVENEAAYYQDEPHQYHQAYDDKTTITLKAGAVNDTVLYCGDDGMDVHQRTPGGMTL